MTPPSDTPCDASSEDATEATPPGFEADVKPLFRPFDHTSMINNGLDLWSYDDVKTNATAIYEQVSTGNMPCDEPWTPDKVATFKAWMDGGYLA